MTRQTDSCTPPGLNDSRTKAARVAPYDAPSAEEAKGPVPPGTREPIGQNRDRARPAPEG